MKAKDKERLGTIRMLLAAIQAEETTGAKHELSDDDVVKVIAREVKKRRESAEIYAENGRQELADAELAEISVLEDYQPAQLDDAAVADLVRASADAVAEGQGVATEELSMKQMGQVMKEATSRSAGGVEGKRLSAAVKGFLQ